MTSLSLWQMADGLAAGWWGWMAAHTIDVAILGAAIWLVDLFCRRCSAAWRHALWCLVLIKILLPVPITSPVSIVGLVQREIVRAQEMQPPVIVGEPKDAVIPVGLSEIVPVADSLETPVSSSPTMPVDAHESMDIRTILFLLWCGAVVVLSLVCIRKTWRLRRTVQKAIPNGDEAVQSRFEQLVTRIRLRRSPVLLTGESVYSPMVYGLFRSRVILPTAVASSLPHDELEPIVAHELAHIRRKDLWINTLQVLCRILFLWHPVMWLMDYRIRRYREEACDDIALHLHEDRSRIYASGILHVVELGYVSPVGALTLLGASEERRGLEKRLRRILTPRRLVTKLSLAGIAALAIIAALVLPGGRAKDSNQDVIKEIQESVGLPAGESGLKKTDAGTPIVGAERNKLLEKIINENNHSMGLVHSGRIELTHFFCFQDSGDTTLEKCTAVFDGERFSEKFQSKQFIGIRGSEEYLRRPTSPVDWDSWHIFDGKRLLFTVPHDNAIYIEDPNKRGYAYHTLLKYIRGNKLEQWIDKAKKDLEVFHESGLYVLQYYNPSIEGIERKWIDPEHGYLVVKTRYQSKNSTFESVISVDDYGNGIWYPRIVHNTGYERQEGELREKNSYLITVDKFVPNDRIDEREFRVSALLYPKVESVKDLRFHKLYSYKVDPATVDPEKLDRDMAEYWKSAEALAETEKGQKEGKETVVWEGNKTDSTGTLNVSKVIFKRVDLSSGGFLVEAKNESAKVQYLGLELYISSEDPFWGVTGFPTINEVAPNATATVWVECRVPAKWGNNNAKIRLARTNNSKYYEQGSMIFLPLDADEILTETFVFGPME